MLPGMPAVLLTFIRLLSGLVTVLILARVVLSWTNPYGGGRLTALVYQLTEPILAPIRRFIPPTGGIDWSPVIAILLLGFVTRLLFSL